MGTLYLYRCITMYVTTLPVPGLHMTCAPKVLQITMRSFNSVKDVLVNDEQYYEHFLISSQPKLHDDSQAKLQRILQLISGGGLSLTGSHHLCGDFLYSGHTVMLTLTYLFIKECK